MAALDRFISLMFEKQGTALVLENDKPVTLEIQGVRRPVTKEAVPTAKVMGLVKEIMPADLHEQFEQEDGRLAFAYAVDGNKVEVGTARSGGAISVVLGPARTRRPTAAVSMPAEALLMNAAPAAAAPPPPVPSPRRSKPNQTVDAAVRSEERIQELLKHLVESKSSDLHMRVGLPPTYRTHGELDQHGTEPLTREDIEAM